MASNQLCIQKAQVAEMKYTVTEKECLAAVFAIKNFRHYLQGRPDFEVITDHHALKWLLSLKQPKGRLARWMMEIQNFSFKVENAPGNQLVVPESLSRDSIPFPLCSKCKENTEIPESVNVVSEASVYRVPTADELRDAQKEQFRIPTS